MSDSVADTTFASPVVPRPAVAPEALGTDPEVEKGKGREEERKETEVQPEPTVDPLDKGDETRPQGKEDR